ncbi:MAG: 4Fe-4S dicluster domain-containing protein [Deltaproteobacteria bacterium]|nr:4Fe-4S dicluster domain-containing protein [Deltaproteobacteria bacterium]MBI2341677.1 4Fe-4S dicluster domain-containing protein [Deltaproteobacteria bacterium]MBI2974879.1 4Fe-4S dicluster domain-containing protein [Deltaproteobacteria bacterium]
MDYFKNIFESAATVFEGLTITASHMFRKPITIQYPDRTLSPVIEMLPSRYRGFLEVDMKICTGCTLCMQACPIQCINIEIAKKTPSPQPSPSRGEGDGGGVPMRLITKFNIDIALCMFCGLCTEPCPTGAIRFSKRFENATEDINKLMFKFVEEGKPVAPYKKSSG